MESPTNFQIAAAVAVVYGTWILLRTLFKKNPLDNVPGPRPAAGLKGWLRGNWPALIHPRSWNYHREVAETYGGALTFKGFLGETQLYIYDPKAMQHVVVKEQDVYERTDTFIINNNLTLGKGLLSTLGETHRRQRKTLNPVFSIAHMREMIPIFYDVAHKLGDSFQAKVQDGPTTIDVLNWMTRTALELVGQSGLGYSFDSLTEGGKEHKFSVAAKLLLPSQQKLNFWRFKVLPKVAHLGPARLQRVIVDFLSLFWVDLRRLRDIVDVMWGTSQEILESKRVALRQGDKALAAKIGRGKDIMSILLKANMSASADEKLDDDELLGQVSTLAFAAMDTTSNALSRILHLMCLHPEAQEKLREEIQEALRERGQLDYDDLVNLPYLDAVCRETMRLYPPVPMLMRQARKDSMLPLSNPVTGADGKEHAEILVPNGTKVFVSVIASNSNPKLWGPDAYEWKPERWTSPLPEALVNAKIPGVYSHLMTFLGGGGACIGFKFSQLEMKVVLVELLSRFKFELGEHKDIYWQMGAVANPTLDVKSSLEPQLPLKVTAINKSS